MHKRFLAIFVICLFWSQCWAMDSDIHSSASPRSPLPEITFPRVLSSLGELGPEYDHLFDTLPDIKTLYLVLNDTHSRQLLTFCSVSRTDLVRRYIAYYLSDITRPKTSAMLVGMKEKFPDQSLKKSGERYALDCTAPGCAHQAVHSSCDVVRLKLFEHYTVEHLQGSPWYQEINGCIADSFEAAVSRSME